MAWHLPLVRPWSCLETVPFAGTVQQRRLQVTRAGWPQPPGLAGWGRPTHHVHQGSSRVLTYRRPRARCPWGTCHSEAARTQTVASSTSHWPPSCFPKAVPQQRGAPPGHPSPLQLPCSFLVLAKLGSWKDVHSGCVLHYNEVKHLLICSRAIWIFSGDTVEGHSRGSLGTCSSIS